MYQRTLPLINNNIPSLSHQYFKYARNELTKGKMNPNIYQLFPQWPTNRMTQSQNRYSYPQLYERNGLIFEKIHSNNPISKFELPRIINTSYIPEAEIIHFPNENNYVPLSQVNRYIPNTLENKPPTFKTKFQTVMIHKKHKQALKNWGFIRSVVHMISLYKMLKRYSQCKINIKSNKLLHFQSFKENLIQIRNFVLPSLHNIDDFCVEFFHKEIIYNTSDVVLKNASIFIVKSFIHQLFTDLTSSFVFKEDIPQQIKYIFNLYIKEDSLVPCEFLSSFEFNRLEFNHKLKLTNMNKERSAMMICMILLYRVILVDIFDKYHTCFTHIKTMNPKIESIECNMRGNKAVNIERIINENNTKHVKRRYDNNYEGDSGLDIYHYKVKVNTDDDDDDSWNDLERKRGNKEDTDERNYIRYRNRIYKGEEDDKHNKMKHKQEKSDSNNDFEFFDDDKDIEGRYIMTINHNKHQHNNPPPPPPSKKKSSKVKNSSNQNDSIFEEKEEEGEEEEDKVTESKKSPSVKSSSTVNQSAIIKPLTFLHQSFGKDDYARIKRDLRRKIKKEKEEEKRLNEEARKKVLSLQNSQYKKKNAINIEQGELDVIVRRNFTFIINVLDYLFRTAIEENVPIYRNDFKESFCYDILVYNNKKEGFRKGNDEIEFLEGVIKNIDISEKFIKNNKRWLRMYVFNVFQFCSDFAQKIKM
jgi:hypothetical protein